jgi:hypothetical protein
VFTKILNDAAFALVGIDGQLFAERNYNLLDQ